MVLIGIEASALADPVLTSAYCLLLCVFLFSYLYAVLYYFLFSIVAYVLFLRRSIFV